MVVWPIGSCEPHLERLILVSCGFSVKSFCHVCNVLLNCCDVSNKSDACVPDSKKFKIVAW